MANDIVAETQVRSIKDADTPDGAANADAVSPADAGSSGDGTANADAASPATADASSSDDSTANGDPRSSPIPEAGAPVSATREDAGSPASPVPDSQALDQITQIAAQSEIAR